jgi:hypothetical protein
MKNLFGKFALLAGLVIVSLSSCDKGETEPTDNPVSYTGMEIVLITTENKNVTVNGIIGKKNVKNDILSKVVISNLDKDGKTVVLYTYENVNLNDANSPLNTKLVGPYGKDDNIVYSFSKTLNVAELGPGVKQTKATTITFQVYDGTNLIISTSWKTDDYGVKL